MSFSSWIKNSVYSILVLILGFTGGVAAISSDEDIPILDDHLCGAFQLSLPHDLPMPEETREDEEEEEEDIPIFAEFLCGTLTLRSNRNSSSTTPFEDEGRQEEREAFLHQNQPGPRPYISQILQARHSKEERKVDGINLRRGEGLPYKYTQNLEGLVKDYKDKKWDGRRLNLSYGSYSGGSLNGLFVFRDLVELNLSGNPLTEEDISRLSTLLHLEKLYLERLPTSTLINFESLNQLHQLKRLSLMDNALIDEDTQALSKLTNLTSLNLNYNHTKVIDAQALSPLTNLTSLELNGNRIIDAEALSVLTNLKNINLFDSRIRSAGAWYLSTLTNLTTLELTGNQIGNKGLQALSNLTALTYLGLCNNRIDDKGTQPLKRIIYFGLDVNRIDDKGTQPLKRLINLRVLRLSQNRIKNLHDLVNLKELNHLNLAYNLIEAKDLHPLVHLRKLKSLYLHGNRISDEGSQILAEFTSLTDLDLAGNQVRNKGLQAIATLTNLSNLRLKINGIGSVEREKLRKKLPKCSITF